MFTAPVDTHWYEYEEVDALLAICWENLRQVNPLKAEQFLIFPMVPWDQLIQILNERKLEEFRCSRSLERLYPNPECRPNLARPWQAYQGLIFPVSVSQTLSRPSEHYVAEWNHYTLCILVQNPDLSYSLGYQDSYGQSSRYLSGFSGTPDALSLADMQFVFSRFLQNHVCSLNSSFIRSNNRKQQDNQNDCGPIVVHNVDWLLSREDPINVAFNWPPLSAIDALESRARQQKILSERRPDIYGNLLRAREPEQVAQPLLTPSSLGLNGASTSLFVEREAKRSRLSVEPFIPAPCVRVSPPILESDSDSDSDSEPEPESKPEPEKKLRYVAKQTKTPTGFILSFEAVEESLFEIEQTLEPVDEILAKIKSLKTCISTNLKDVYLADYNQIRTLVMTFDIHRSSAQYLSKFGDHCFNEQTYGDVRETFLNALEQYYIHNFKRGHPVDFRPFNSFMPEPVEIFTPVDRIGQQLVDLRKRSRGFQGDAEDIRALAMLIGVDIERDIAALREVKYNEQQYLEKREEILSKLQKKYQYG